jgi:hypothetical protein
MFQSFHFSVSDFIKFHISVKFLTPGLETVKWHTPVPYSSCRCMSLRTLRLHLLTAWIFIDTPYSPKQQRSHPLPPTENVKVSKLAYTPYKETNRNHCRYMECHLPRLTFVVTSLLLLAVVHAVADPDAYIFIGCHTDEEQFLNKTYFGSKSAGSYASAVDAAAGAPLFAVAKNSGKGELEGHGFSFPALGDAGAALDSSLPGCKQECSDSTKFCGTSRDTPGPGEYYRVWAVYQKLAQNASPSHQAATPSPSPSALPLPSVKQASQASAAVPPATTQAAPAQDTKHTGLSDSDKIELALGLGIGLPGLIAAVVAAHYGRRMYKMKKNAAKPAHP